MSITQHAGDVLGSRQDAQAMAERTAYLPFIPALFSASSFFYIFFGSQNVFFLSVHHPLRRED